MEDIMITDSTKRTMARNLYFEKNCSMQQIELRSTKLTHVTIVTK